MLLEIVRGVQYSKLQYFPCLNYTKIRHLTLKLHSSAKLKEVLGLNLTNEFKFPFLSTFIFAFYKNIMKNGWFLVDHQINDLYWLIKRTVPDHDC
jgi:hypothetical protein